MATKIRKVAKSELSVESLLNEAKEEISTETTKKMVSKIKAKLIERQSAAKILSNIDRDIEMMKVELQQELESLDV